MLVLCVIVVALRVVLSLVFILVVLVIILRLTGIGLLVIAAWSASVDRLLILSVFGFGGLLIRTILVLILLLFLLLLLLGGGRVMRILITLIASTLQAGIVIVAAPSAILSISLISSFPCVRVSVIVFVVFLLFLLSVILLFNLHVFLLPTHLIHTFLISSRILRLPLIIAGRLLGARVRLGFLGKGIRSRFLLMRITFAMLVMRGAVLTMTRSSV
jgi:hypothetical protein